MEQKKSPGNGRKTETVAFRVTPAERHLIEAMAAENGLLLADLLRSLVVPTVRDRLLSGAEETIQ